MKRVMVLGLLLGHRLGILVRKLSSLEEYLLTFSFRIPILIVELGDWFSPPFLFLTYQYWLNDFEHLLQRLRLTYTRDHL